MTKIQKTAGLLVGPLAVTLVVLLGATVSAQAGAPRHSGFSVQLAAQQLQAPTRGTGPVRRIAPRRLTARPGTSANASYGCHDGASMTSYEGPCDYHPEYEATGGCESEATGTSYPGNCRNSSEP